MRRLWRVYRVFFTSSLAREMEFRANFFAKILQNAVWAGFFVLVLLAIYHNTPEVAGWNRGMAFLLTATVFLVSGLTGALTMGLMEIPSQVRMGTLDFVLARPIDQQFWVSLRRFNFDQFGTLGAGLLLVAVGLPQSGLSPSPGAWLAYALMVLGGAVLFYCLNLVLMTLGIWWVRVDNLWVLGETAMSVSRFPLEIFPRAAIWTFTFLVPVALFAALPTQQLVRGVQPQDLVVSILWTAVALVGSRAFWKYALRHYSSASS